MMMMPVYPGAPWVPKFKGPDSDVKYGDWKEQIHGLLNAQDVAEARKVDILTGALAGEAKRQVSVLGEGDRDQARKIFTYLDSLYGDNTPVAVLRSNFFGCIQKPDESVKSFTLRLRDIYCWLLRRSPDDSPSEANLQEQMLLGLQEGPLSQTLRAYVRRHPDQDFAAVHREALLLEEEQGGHRGLEATCFAVGESRHTRTPVEPDWKESLKREIMNDVKEQMKGLAQEVINEIKPLLQHTANAPSHHHPRFGQRQPSYNNTWTSDGQPVCRRCNQAGHMARFCRATPNARPALN